MHWSGRRQIPQVFLIVGGLEKANVALRLINDREQLALMREATAENQAAVERMRHLIEEPRKPDSKPSTFRGNANVTKSSAVEPHSSR